jgi:glycosyltransferase involved in cell wall biosynthesis
VFPSLWYETLGLAVLESMAFGIPCLVPSECAASDLIKDEVNGVIYKSGNKESMIEAIQKMNDNSLVKALSDQAYKDFDESYYSMENHAKKLVSVYQSCLTK